MEFFSKFFFYQHSINCKSVLPCFYRENHTEFKFNVLINFSMITFILLPNIFYSQTNALMRVDLKSISANTGIQNIVLPNSIENYSFQTYQVGISTEVYNIPFNIIVKASIINGDFLINASGFDIQYDKGKHISNLLKSKDLSSLNEQKFDDSILDSINRFLPDLPYKDSLIFLLKNIQSNKSLDSLQFKRNELSHILDKHSLDINKDEYISQFFSEHFNSIREKKLSKLSFNKQTRLNPNKEINFSKLKSSKLNKFLIEHVNKFNLGIVPFLSTELIGSGKNFYGFDVDFGINSNSNLKVSIGSTLKLPSISNLILFPSFLANGNAVPQNAFDLNSNTINFNLNRDFLNLYTNSEFVNLEYSSKIDNSTEFKLRNITSRFENSLNKGLSNMVSFSLDRSISKYKLSFEIANASTTIVNSINGDSILPFRREIPFSIAYKISLLVPISSRISVNAYHKNLQPNYYSPYFITNNNLTEDDMLKVNYTSLRKKIIFFGILNRKQFITLNNNTIMNSISSGFTVKLLDKFSLLSQVSRNIFFSPTRNSKNFSGTFTLDYAPHNSRVKSSFSMVINEFYLSSFDSTAVVSNNNLMSTCVIDYKVSAKYSIRNGAEYIQLSDFKVINVKHIHTNDISKKTQVQLGLIYINALNRQWLNLFAGLNCKIPNSKFSLNFSTDMTIVTTADNIFNGQISITKSF